jgi:hypothetical protein
MPIIDVFNTNAFNAVELTRAINVVPNMYGRLRELNIFPGKGVTTTTVSIEIKNGVLFLLPTAPRGAPAGENIQGKRSLKSFTVPHIPHDDVVLPEEVQNVRAFGTDNQLEGVQNVVNDKLATMRNKHAITLEHLRAGALKGIVLDADGSTILNLFTDFGVAEKTVDFDLDNAATDVQAKCMEVVRHIEDNLLGDVMTGVRAFCSPEFFDAFTGHPKVTEAFKYFSSQQDLLRRDTRKGFAFKDILWEEYRGSAGHRAADGTVTQRKFIPTDHVRFVPEGTQESFNTFFAPADFMEAVNTPGLEVYAKQEPRKFNRGIDIHTQSNPLPLCMRPATLVKGVRT